LNGEREIAFGCRAILDHLQSKYRQQVKTLFSLNFQNYEDEPVLVA
jgi:hypothetical protein